MAGRGQLNRAESWRYGTYPFTGMPDSEHLITYSNNGAPANPHHVRKRSASRSPPLRIGPYSTVSPGLTTRSAGGNLLLRQNGRADLG